MSKPGKSNPSGGNGNGKPQGRPQKTDGGSPKPGRPNEPAPPKTYHEGEPFPGRIGRTWDVSEPAFPVPREAPKGAPNILYIVLDDVGFGWSSTFGGLVETPNITTLANNGLSYINSPHDGALLADARVPAHRAQPPLGRHGEHHRARDGLPRLQRPPAAGQGRHRGRCCTSTATRRSRSASGTTPPSEETSVERPLRSLADRAGLRLRSLLRLLRRRQQPVVSEALPRSRADRSAAPARGGLPPVRRHHRPGDLASSRNHESVDPDKPWLCLLRVRCLPRAAPRRAGVERQVQGQVRHGLGQVPRASCSQRQKKLGVVPPHDRARADARGRAEVGRPLGRREAPLRAHGRGLRRLPRRTPTRRSAASSSSSRTTGALDNTLVFVFIGDNGSSGEGTLNGLYNEMSLVTTSPRIPKEVLEEDRQARPARLVQPLSRSAGRWRATRRSSCASSTRTSAARGIRSSCTGRTGIEAKGELRHQFHHVIDIVPTILDGARRRARRRRSTACSRRRSRACR